MKGRTLKKEGRDDPLRAERAGRGKNSKTDQQIDIEKVKGIGLTDIFSILAGGFAKHQG